MIEHRLGPSRESAVVHAVSKVTVRGWSPGSKAPITESATRDKVELRYEPGRMEIK